MPLDPLQSLIMRIIAVRRTAGSYVAGGAPIAAITDRFSGDFDVFHDPDVSLEETARADARALEERGVSVRWTMRKEGAWTAEVSKGSRKVRLEWRKDSAFRFFPTQPDDVFGYVLHPADQITNKLLTIADRSEARDVFDVVALASAVPIPAAVIAAPGKDAGYNPTSLIKQIRRNAGHPQEAFDRLRTTAPIDGGPILREFRAALDQAEEIAASLPLEAIGKFYLHGGRIVIPDPLRLAEYEAVTGGVKGVVLEFPDLPFDPGRGQGGGR